MKYILILCVFIAIVHSVKGIDCSKLYKTDLINSADNIFIGKILGSSNTNYSVEVIEWFKGVKKDSIVYLKRNEDMARLTTSKYWLFYTVFDVSGMHLIHPCDGSKPLNRPFNANNLYQLEHPPRAFNDANLLYLNEEIFRGNAFDELYFELYNLAAYRLESEISDLQTELQSQTQRIQEFEDQIKKQNLILYIIIGILIIQFVYLKFAS